MKKLAVLIVVLALLINLTTVVFASEGNQSLDVKIISPSAVEDFPGREETVKVEVTNHSNQDLQKVLVYITMADLNKNMTVNLEDYNADKPVYIETLKAGETQTIDLPVRFVYTSSYHLYVTVVSKENNLITSSAAIPIHIIGNTMINKPVAFGVVITEPIILLFIVMGAIIYRKRKYEVK